MDTAELREMSEEQLMLELKNTADTFFRLRIQAQTERLDAPSELRRHRRLIARIKTVLREREIANYVKVKARFVDGTTGLALHGSEYQAKLVGNGMKAPLAEGGLDGNGRVLFECDLKSGNDAISEFAESRPDVYVVLEKDSKQVFRTKNIKEKSLRLTKQICNLGTIKI